MNPHQLSTSLRHIASKIENSKNPQRDLVIADLKKIIAGIDDTVSTPIRVTINTVVDIPQEQLDHITDFDLVNLILQKIGDNKYIDDGEIELEFV